MEVFKDNKEIHTEGNLPEKKFERNMPDIILPKISRKISDNSSTNTNTNINSNTNSYTNAVEAEEKKHDPKKPEWDTVEYVTPVIRGNLI